MADQKFKPIFKRSLSEQLDLIRPEVERVQMENLSLGLYNSYIDRRYKSTDIIVRKYKDRKEIIKVDAHSGLTEIIKIIR